MNKIFIVFILMLLTQICHADDSSGNLTIQVRGMIHDRGQLIANLFRERDDVMKIDKAYLRAQDKIINNQAQLVFKNLKYGKYAVSVFHDENGNGNLDHSLLKMPAEPIGFSSGFHLGMFSGLPSFGKLQFDFGQGIGTILITVK